MRKILPDLCLLAAMPLLVYSVHRVFLETPIERQMGTAFKIFFFHVPMGWLCMLMAVVCGVAAGVELRAARRSPARSPSRRRDGLRHRPRRPAHRTDLGQRHLGHAVDRRRPAGHHRAAVAGDRRLPAAAPLRPAQLRSPRRRPGDLRRRQRADHLLRGEAVEDHAPEHRRGRLAAARDVGQLLAGPHRPGPLFALGLFGLRIRQLALADELDAAWVRVEDNH
jgi:hypothetical protein